MADAEVRAKKDQPRTFVCRSETSSRVSSCWVARFYVKLWQIVASSNNPQVCVGFLFFSLVQSLSFCPSPSLHPTVWLSAMCYSRPANWALSTVSSNWEGKLNVCWVNWMVNYVRRYQMILYCHFSYQFKLLVILHCKVEGFPLPRPFQCHVGTFRECYQPGIP